MTSGLELVSSHRVHNGQQCFYRHTSAVIGLPMRFAVFKPDQVTPAPMPALFYLAGLTCTEETFPIKAGAQRLASALGMMLIAPDTSPRGAGVPGEDDNWDFGTGAGFYVDATELPWRTHYQMYSYIVDELYGLVTGDLGGDPSRIGIFGHSMGGHGALVLALRNPAKFRSVSAFAPIAAPSQCPWGKKAFVGYLGDDTSAWAAYDASMLMRDATCPFPAGILVDQGLADNFLRDGQLYPDVFEQACAAARQPLQLRRHEGFDHGYYFISTFVDDHIRFHARNLGLSS